MSVLTSGLSPGGRSGRRRWWCRGGVGWRRCQRIQEEDSRKARRKLGGLGGVKGFWEEGRRWGGGEKVSEDSRRARRKLGGRTPVHSENFGLTLPGRPPITGLPLQFPARKVSRSLGEADFSPRGQFSTVPASIGAPGRQHFLSCGVGTPVSAYGGMAG